MPRSESLLEFLRPECFADRWLNEVFAARTINGETRVLLILLAQIMDESGKVSVPEAELAQVLDRHRSRVVERIKRAIDAGFLVREKSGQQWGSARYRAVMPEGGMSGDTGDASEGAAA